jgi:RHS repeat-associated protein
VIAAKAFDPVTGVDVHIIQPPGPVPPVPVPHPFVGMLVDPMDFAPIIGSTVMVNGMPRATAGTGGQCIPPHIPIGGTFIKPPANECEVFMGSSTVVADGDPLSFMGMPVLSCHDVGMPPPPRPKKKRKTKSLVLPTSVVLPVPAGAPVLVGGPPTVSMMALGMKAGMAALGAAFRRLRSVQRGSRRMRAVSDRVHRSARRAMDRLGVPPSAQNRVHRAICTATGHPVDVATGKVFTEAVDFELPGPLPLRWERVWYSSSVYDGPLGHGWHHTYDLALLEDQEAGVVALRTADGRGVAFPTLAEGGVYRDRTEKLTLRRGHDGFTLRDRRGTTYCFGEADPLTGIRPLQALEGRSGGRIDLVRGAGGRLTGILDSAGRKLTIRTDARGRLAAVLGPDPSAPQRVAELVVFLYDEWGDLVEVRDALGNATRYEYDAHLLTREIDRVGFAYHFEWDSRDGVSRCVRTWGDGGMFARRLAYDPVALSTAVEDSLGHVTRYESTPEGVVTVSTDPRGGVTRKEYSEHMELVRVEDSMGRVTEYEYDDRGNCIAMTEPGGSRVEAVVDDEDRLVEATDALGGRWRWTWDTQGRLLGRTDPLGQTTRYVWEGPRLTRFIDRAGGETTVEYDEEGNVARLVDPSGIERLFSYDALGRTVWETDRRGVATRWTRDPVGRPRAVERSDGASWKLATDAEGRLVQMRSEYGLMAWRYDGTGRIREWVDNGRALRFEHDSEGRLALVVNEHGHEYRYERDPDGSVIAETDFDGRRRTFQRDLLGRIESVIHPNGRREKRTYDAAGHLTEVRDSDGRTERFVYRSDHRLVEAGNGAGTLRFQLDLLGRPVEERWRDHWVRSTYDAMGRRVAVESSLGHRQEISRDAGGNVTGLRAEGPAEGATWSVVIRRDATGFEGERILPGGVTSAWVHDDRGLPLRWSVRSEGELRTRSYRWDGTGRLAGWEDSEAGPARFAYDAYGALAAVRRGAEREVRAPDAAGHIFGTLDRTDREHGPSGQVLRRGQTSYGYDPEGRLIRRVEPDGGSWELEWGVSGRILSIRRPDGVTARYGYDPLGRRVSKTVDGETVEWLWDRDRVLHEGRLEAGALDAVTTWVFDPDGYVPWARFAPGGGSFSVVADHIGAPLLMFDQAGRRVWAASRDSQGRFEIEDGSRSDCPFRFPGHYEDVESGLHYSRFRYYDPGCGVFMSPDPLGLVGGLRPYGYPLDPNLLADPLALHTVLGALNGTPVERPTGGGNTTPFWNNVGGSGGNDMAPSGLGRAGDSENLFLEHLEANHPDQLDGAFVEIDSIRSGRGSALPPCDLCESGLQEFADRNNATVVYRVTEGRGSTRVGSRRVRQEFVFRPRCG